MMLVYSNLSQSSISLEVVLKQAMLCCGGLSEPTTDPTRRPHRERPDVLSCSGHPAGAHMAGQTGAQRQRRERPGGSATDADQRDKERGQSSGSGR